MFIVVSKWEALPGREAEWRAKSQAIGAKLRAVPGVEALYRFENEVGQLVVIMGYADEATYLALVDERGGVSQVMAESNLESVARWVSSERGRSVD